MCSKDDCAKYGINVKEAELLKEESKNIPNIYVKTGADEIPLTLLARAIKKDLTGKLIIVTGSSDGIGLETAKELLNSNAKVIFACRNKNKTESIINNFPERIKKNAIFIPLNLDSFKSIKNFADEIKSKFPKIDILINNAGMSSLGKIYKTEDGHLNVFQEIGRAHV